MSIKQNNCVVNKKTSILMISVSEKFLVIKWVVFFTN